MKKYQNIANLFFCGSHGKRGKVTAGCDNVIASQIGQCVNECHQKWGKTDIIDLGLAVIIELEKHGFNLHAEGREYHG